MRFLDDRARLLGVINLFDLLALMLILAMIIPGLLFQFKYARDKKAIDGKAYYSNVYKYVRAKAYLVSDVADLIKKGDRIVDANGHVTVEVKEILFDKPLLVEALVGEGVVKPRLSVHKSISYKIDDEDGRRVSLARHSESAWKVEKIESLRVVEVIFKLLCRMERDGSFIGLQEGYSPKPGRNVAMATDDYSAEFTIVEVIK